MTIVEERYNKIKDWLTGYGKFVVNEREADNRVHFSFLFFLFYCATANPIEVIYVETSLGRAIIGVVDGFKPKGIENDDDVDERSSFLRRIGYKF